MTSHACFGSKAYTYTGNCPFPFQWILFCRISSHLIINSELVLVITLLDLSLYPLPTYITGPGLRGWILMQGTFNRNPVSTQSDWNPMNIDWLIWRTFFSSLIKTPLELVKFGLAVCCAFILFTYMFQSVKDSKSSSSSSTGRERERERRKLELLPVHTQSCFLSAANKRDNICEPKGVICSCSSLRVCCVFSSSSSPAKKKSKKASKVLHYSDWKILISAYTLCSFWTVHGIIYTHTSAIHMSTDSRSLEFHMALYDVALHI